VKYVDAGYVAALGTMFVYGVSLLLRRRRWERALSVSQAGEVPEAPSADGASELVVPIAPGEPGVGPGGPA
jgi:hypothetical protein